IMDQGKYYSGVAVNGNGDLYVNVYNTSTGNYDVIKYTNGGGSPSTFYSGLSMGSGSELPCGIGSNLALGDILVPDP
ncbi:hypothetical protein SB781_40855, partial [Paraburkholderia sp. SIMBA_061]